MGTRKHPTHVPGFWSWKGSNCTSLVMVAALVVN